jgi:hypothetical protein
MGMKPRKKTETELFTPMEHDHPSVKALVTMSGVISENPGEFGEALSWALAVVLEHYVAEVDLDDAINGLRNEILAKACLLKVNAATKDQLWSWVNEGLDIYRKEKESL